MAEAISDSVPKRCSGTVGGNPGSWPWLRAVAVEAAGGDAARRHAVHAHAGGGPSAGSRLSHHQRAARIGAAVREVRPPVPDVGDDVDDGAAMVLHPAVEGLAHEDEAAGEVVAHHRLEAPSCGDGLHRRAELAAGVVHQAIESGRATRAPASIHRGRDQRFVPDVGGGRWRCRRRFRSRPAPPPAFPACGRPARRARPARTSSCAVQRPMPLPPPVTMTVWPAKRPGL